MIAETANSSLLSALRAVAVNGSYNASRALSKWLKKGVRLTSDGFVSTPIAEVASSIGGEDEPIAAIHMPLMGDMSGHMLLTFPEHVALQFVDMMMMAPPGTATELDEIGQSCLQETGNIVASAYANSLAKWLELTFEPGVPTFAYDMAASLVDPLLGMAAAESDDVFIANTEFLLDSQRLEWGLLLLPSAKSWALMESRCQAESVRQNALRTIAVNGAFNASRALSKWLTRGVKLSTGGFERTPLSEVGAMFSTDVPIVALRMPLSDRMHGHSFLAMTEANALLLCDMLMQQPAGTAVEFGEIERSCLEETGNIVSSSYMNGWSTWLDMEIAPGPPEFATDLPEAILDGLVAEQAIVSDEVFMARTDFFAGEQCLEWMFVFVPAPSAMRLIESSCR